MNDNTIEFANHVISVIERMPAGRERQRLLTVASGRYAGKGRPLVGTESVGERIYDGVARCLDDKRYFALATLAVLARGEHLLPAMLDGIWPGNCNFLLETGHQLAHGARADLDDLVLTVELDGWASLDMYEGDEDVPHTVSRDIAARCDQFAKINPSWAEEAEASFDENALDHDEFGRNLAEFQAMMEWNQRRAPYPGPLGRSEDESLVELDVVTTDLCSIAGVASEAANAGVVRTEERTRNRERLSILSLPQLLAQPVKPRQMVCSPMLERGVVTIIGAQPGVGKSTLTAQLAASIALGRDFAGFEVPEAVPVLYLNAEDHLEETKRRFAGIAQHMQTSPAQFARLHIVGSGNKVRLMDKGSGIARPSETGEGLRQTIVKSGAAAVVMDPVALLHDLDENYNADMTAFVEFLHSIAREANCAILLVHHSKKDTKAKGMDALRGAGAIAASVRSIYTLTENENSGLVTLDCVKANNHVRGNQSVDFRRESIVLSTGDTVGVLVPN
ncbi:MAG: helicase RepA family protein [Pseudomonadota bacterium]|nr:helicase RepA family protein [Pseudomonadota bacterium]